MDKRQRRALEQYERNLTRLMALRLAQLLNEIGAEPDIIDVFHSYQFAQSINPDTGFRAIEALSFVLTGNWDSKDPWGKEDAR